MDFNAFFSSEQKNQVVQNEIYRVEDKKKKEEKIANRLARKRWYDIEQPNINSIKVKYQKKEEEFSNAGTTASPHSAMSFETDEPGGDINKQEFKNPYGEDWKAALNMLNSSAQPPQWGQAKYKKFQSNKIKIWSWNINGMNAITDKNKFKPWIEKVNPDIIIIQEIKTSRDVIVKKDFFREIPDGYEQHWNTSKVRRGYAGVALFSKVKPIRVLRDICIDKHDQEGRVLAAEYENFYFVGTYIPNSGDECKRIQYRVQEWDWDFLCFLKTLEKNKPVILGGDLNISHHDIDIYYPEYMQKKKPRTPGTTPEERQNFTSLLDYNFVDTFRHFYPDVTKFSFWSVFSECRERNRGLRLDYFVCSKSFMKYVTDSTIHKEFEGSDHCPIMLKLDMSGRKGGNSENLEDRSDFSYGLSQPPEQAEFSYGKFSAEQLNKDIEEEEQFEKLTYGHQDLEQHNIKDFFLNKTVENTPGEKPKIKVKLANLINFD